MKHVEKSTNISIAQGLAIGSGLILTLVWTIRFTGDWIKSPDPVSPREKNVSYLSPISNTGHKQSPIDIRTFRVSNKGSHGVTYDYHASHERIANLGTTIQVIYDEGNTLSYDDQVFDFKQFHFHTPAEHLLDGITYPMEMHMVHTSDKGFCVVSVLFKEGKENDFLNQFIDEIPERKGVERQVIGGRVNVEDLLREEDNLNYYHYQGSLTTPPYTENVNWLVVQEVFEASHEQIARINQLEGNNARHIQAINNREVDVAIQ